MELYDEVDEWSRKQYEEHRKLGEEQKAKQDAAREVERRAGALEKATAYLKTGASNYLQYDSQFVHKGVITFGELESYEKQITKQEAANKMFLRDFRMRMSQMSMMDPTFGRLISNIAPEYKAIVDEAPAAERKLEKTANLSGLNKVMHGVSKSERRQARRDVENLKKSRESKYRQQYDTKEKKENWLQFRLDSQIYENLSVGLREQKTYCGDIVESTLEISASEYAPGSSREEALAHRDSKAIFKEAVNFYVNPQKMDEVEKKKSQLQGKERIRDVAMLEKATTKDLSWTDITYRTKDFLAACGKGEFEQLTRRKAMEGMEQHIEEWGKALSERPAIKAVVQADGDPAVYQDQKVRTELAQIMEECKGALRITEEIRKGWPFNTIFYPDEQAKFEAVDYWAQGYMEYVTAVFDHMDKWDLFYRSEAPGTMASKPTLLPPPARFLSR